VVLLDRTTPKHQDTFHLRIEQTLPQDTLPNHPGRP